MTAILILDNEMITLDDLDFLTDHVRFVVYVNTDEKFILNTNHKMPVKPNRICDPRELEI